MIQAAPESFDSGSESQAHSRVAFAAFARRSTRRHVTAPLILSAALAVALVASFVSLSMRLDGDTGMVLEPFVERFLGSGFTRAIVIVFLTAAIYGALQLIGIVVDRDRLRWLGLPDGEYRTSWLALIAGRPFRPRTGGAVLWADAAQNDPHEIADRYAVQRHRHAELGLLPLRFCVWVLPLLGFIGTVVGIARSIKGLEGVIDPGTGGRSAEGLLSVLGGLQFAFDTTLLGLVTVIPVMLVHMILGGRESEQTEECPLPRARTGHFGRRRRRIGRASAGRATGGLASGPAGEQTGRVVAVLRFRVNTERGTSAVPVAGVGAAAPMSLLPFLDIVFGTIGIFVVTFALQNIVEVKEGIPPGIDSIVTCVEGDRLTAHWPDGSTGPMVSPERSLDLLQALAGDGRPFRTLLLALGGNCHKVRTAFLDGFERYLEMTTRTVAAQGRSPGALMLELYPLGDGADAAALLKEWRGDDEK